MADDRRVIGVRRGEQVRFRLDGQEFEAHTGETVAAALWAAGHLALRGSTARSAPRGVFCNMGICFECLVWLDGRTLRACMLQVTDGMELQSYGQVR